MPDIWAPAACHVFTGLPGYRDPAMMFGCRAAYPQPSIGGDDDVADRTNPGPHPNDGPTAHGKRLKTFDVLRFCDCGRHGGLHGIAPGCPGMADEIAQLVPGDAPGTIRASYDPDFVPRYDAQGNVFLIPIPDDEDGPPLTADVIASYDRELVHAGRKRQTLLTYRKAWKQFEAAFERLPTDRDLILDYLGNFDGPSGRYRLNNQDSIHYLYKHAVSLGWMVSDPMYGMKRPNIQEQMPNPMTLEQVGMVLALDMSLRERAAGHLLAGHGWRQNEVLEVLAGEVRAISGGQMWCHGKQRAEWAPVLPETAELLSRLADGLADDEQVFRGKRGRNEKFGYEGMRKLVRDLMRRAGLTGFTGHNLRDTFATLVTEESGDLTLAMQLIRDKVPGVASRYVKRDLPALLERHSPIRQLERKPSPQKGESGVLVGESLVETGES